MKLSFYFIVGHLYGKRCFAIWQYLMTYWLSIQYHTLTYISKNIMLLNMFSEVTILKSTYLWLLHMAIWIWEKRFVFKICETMCIQDGYSYFFISDTSTLSKQSRGTDWLSVHMIGQSYFLLFLLIIAIFTFFNNIVFITIFYIERHEINKLSKW